MRKFLPVLLILLFCVPAFAADSPATEREKTLYALGHLMNRSIVNLRLTPAELEFVKRGLTDANAGKAPAVDMAVYGPKVQEMAMAARKSLAEKSAAENKAFLEKAAREKGAVKTPSGLVYLSLKEGTGKQPGPEDTVKAHYRGTFIDGREFDSSYRSGTPGEFQLNKVIKCFGEGMRRMKAGGKARLVCPASTANGDRGMADVIPPGATLVFEIELLDIKAK